MSTEYHDPDWLEARYHGDGLTQREIAEVCDVAPVTIRRWMKRHGIETREITGENHGLYGKERSEETRRKISEALEGREFSEETRTRISEAHQGREFPPDVRRKISESLSGITRSMETREKMSESTAGEANPAWNGGEWERSWYGGKTWHQARRRVVERDGCCQSCGDNGTDVRLEVHHIVPIRLFAADDEVTVEHAHHEGNLILLCSACHKRAEYGDLSLIPEYDETPDQIVPSIRRIYSQFVSQ